ncbi:MAG: hypothetical protein K2K94_07200, partial [Muribaculaceae bacterium]|nr:hypothetical protein [Muribaculaceae bacterium]
KHDKSVKLIDVLLFPLSQAAPEPLTLKECKKHCCCGMDCFQIYAYALDRYYPQVADKFKNAKGYVIDSIIGDAVSQLLSTDDVSYNPLDVVRLAYKDFCYCDWEWCLDHKLDLSDCVSGCYSGVIDFDHRRPHPHQRLPFYRWHRSFCYMTDKTQSDEFLNINVNDFECLRLQIENHKKAAPDKAPGFGALAIYDEALRIAWHTQCRESLLPGEVYIHNGALWGAEALWHIGRIIGRKIIDVDEAALETPKMPHDVFDKHLVDGLPCHHVENQLCTFHNLFEELERRIRIAKGLPQRHLPPERQKNKIKKHYKLLNNN